MVMHVVMTVAITLKKKGKHHNKIWFCYEYMYLNHMIHRRVLRRLELDLSDDVIRALSNCKQRVVEKVLMMLRVQIDKFIEKSNRLRLKTLQLQNVLGIKEPVDPELDACKFYSYFNQKWGKQT